MVTQENAFCSAYCTKGEILCHLEFKLHQQQKDKAQKRNCFNQLLNLLGYMKVHYTVSSIFMFALIKKKKSELWSNSFVQTTFFSRNASQPTPPYINSSLRILFAFISEHNYVLNLSLFLVSATRNALLHSSTYKNSTFCSKSIENVTFPKSFGENWPLYSKSLFSIHSTLLNV